MSSRRRTVCFSLIALLPAICAGGQQASHKRRRLTLLEARQLVYKAVEPQGATKLPRFGLDYYKDDHFRDFYFFEATADHPGPGSGVLGHYGVDPRTGNVWDGVVCRELTSPSLRKLQQTVRTRIRLTEKEYRKLRRPGPMC